MSKRLVFTIAAALLITPVFFQVSAYGVSAESPMTAPATFCNLVGKITYKQLGKLFNGSERIRPAGNVTVKVKGFFDKSKEYEVKSDAEGNYALQVPAGMYIVEVEKGSSTETSFFTPPISVEKVKDQKESRANFQGLLFR